MYMAWARLRYRGPGRLKMYDSLKIGGLCATTSRGGNSKSLEVKSEGIRVLHNCRPSVASDSFRYLRRIPSLGIFLLLLPLAHLQ